MPKAAKKAAAKALAKVYQKVNVDFYRVADVAGGKSKFRDALLELKTRQGPIAAL